MGKTARKQSARTAYDYLVEELRSGNTLSEDAREALDALAFLYGSEEAAKAVVLGGNPKS